MMKKKNGFISISIIYSFFVVFMLLLVLIMASYVNNRTSLNIYKKDIKARIAQNSPKLGIAYLENKENYNILETNGYKLAMLHRHSLEEKQ